MRPVAALSLASVFLLVGCERSTPEPMLPEAGTSDDWLAVETHCQTCHSMLQLASQRGDERFWRNIIVRMQREHGLASVDAETAERLARTLAARLGPDDETESRPAWIERPIRRAPLPRELLPPVTDSR